MGSTAIALAWASVSLLASLTDCVRTERSPRRMGLMLGLPGRELAAWRSMASPVAGGQACDRRVIDTSSRPDRAKPGERRAAAAKRDRKVAGASERGAERVAVQSRSTRGTQLRRYW